MAHKTLYIKEDKEEIFERLKEREDGSMAEHVTKAVELYLDYMKVEKEGLDLDPALIEGVKKYAEDTNKTPREALNEIVADLFDRGIYKTEGSEEVYPFRKYADPYYERRSK